MLPDQFITTRHQAWRRLTDLLDRSRSGLVALSAEEVIELGRLYRSATSDLAVARRDFGDHQVVDYLHGLVARGHATVYRAPAARGRALLTFFSTTFPQAFRATWGATFAAFLMFFIPALIAFAVAYDDPAAGAALVPGAADVIDDIRIGHEWWLRINDEGRSASASLIMTNNIRVAILAFAGGMLFGLLTLYVLVQNGLLLGVIAGASQAYGFAGNLWGFVAAHGVVELSVIFIAGGAGLQIGWALI
ncbi:MAG TPA: stage II sporulation protein M, partial [Roseiflexaceae bacterium]|nr:stage II sporulation protein M [Roseiflexaceae bacterium]